MLIDVRSADGTRLALHDLGGDGPPALLLPGLCGYAGEWATTASWLTESHHVYALDPRGHGQSERRPADVSRAAHVADAVAALQVTGPAVVVGQSLGGHTAMLTAARHPHLVTRLVLAEAGPERVGDGAPQDIADWLAGWPVPFPDLATAADHLGGGAVGEAWARGLRRADDGWYPAFDPDVMVATIAAAGGPYWDDFGSIRCPTLVVRGGNGTMAAEEHTRMCHHPQVTGAVIPGAGHDVHLDGADAWRAAVSGFLARSSAT